MKGKRVVPDKKLKELDALMLITMGSALLFSFMARSYEEGLKAGEKRANASDEKGKVKKK